MVSSTLWPGNWPPSPGLAPCAILICIMSELTRYSVVTPKRPEATCLIAERMRIAVRQRLEAVGSPRRLRRCSTCRRSGSWRSRAWCAPRARSSRSDIAPVAKRLTMSLAGSTSSIGTGLRPSSSARLDAEQAADGQQPLGLLVEDLGEGAVAAPANCRARRAGAPRPSPRSRHDPRRARGTDIRRRHRARRDRSAHRRTRRDGGARFPRRSRRGRRPRCGCAVPVKYFATKSALSPTASKICAPQ